MEFNIVGVYSVPEARQPCHLIEIIVRATDGKLDFGEVTQEAPDDPRDNWQVPWGEQILNSEGTSGQPVPFPEPVALRGEVRAAFFFHFLDHDRPLLTPSGAVELPGPTARPARLDFIEYEETD